MSDYLYSSNLYKKLDNPPKLKVIDCLCLWSDLLGFGKQFTDKNWKLSHKDWENVRSRLLAAHSIAIKHTSHLERLLILNDGIAKVVPFYDSKYQSLLLQASIFFREVVMIHQEIKKNEAAKELPGARSVVAFGNSASYIEEEFKLDDYYFNYTKPDPEGLSTAAKRTGNPTIIYNPSQLQMNTAFSKAYILESAGSKGGLKGANLFIDRSVIDVLKIIANHEEGGFVWEETDDYVEFTVPREGEKKENVVIGFRFDKPFKPSVGWDTEIYRVRRFYPWDELTDDFYFDLDSPQGWGGD